jgi:hypothetical protein
MTYDELLDPFLSQDIDEEEELSEEIPGEKEKGEEEESDDEEWKDIE